MSNKRKGVVITMKGLQLITKLAAGVGALEISAVKVGTGILPEDTDPLTMDDIISYKMDGMIADYGYDSETKNGYVVMQLSNDGLENGFVMTEIGLYAVDPDLGEILYAYVDMSDDPNYIMPAENGRHKLVQMKLHVIVDGTQGITAVINPAAQITKEVFDQEIQNIVTPDFDDSGEVEDINSFTDFMSSFVKNTSIYQLFANLKAGLQYVLHAGQLVNNGLCEESGKFALDAAYGHTMTEQITQLYSDIADGINLRWNPESNRIQVNYNGVWVNYPPSYVGNSIYLIHNGEILVPYTIIREPLQFTDDGGEVFLSLHTGGPDNPVLPYIRLDKIVSFDEPYELHLNARAMTSGKGVGVSYAGVSIVPNGTVYADKFSTINEASGEVSISLIPGYPANTNIGIYIKDLYFRRIRE